MCSMVHSSVHTINNHHRVHSSVHPKPFISLFLLPKMSGLPCRHGLMADMVRSSMLPWSHGWHCFYGNGFYILCSVSNVLSPMSLSCLSPHKMFFTFYGTVTWFTPAFTHKMFLHFMELLHGSLPRSPPKMFLHFRELLPHGLQGSLQRSPP